MAIKTDVEIGGCLFLDCRAYFDPEAEAFVVETRDDLLLGEYRSGRIKKGHDGEVWIEFFDPVKSERRAMLEAMDNVLPRIEEILTEYMQLWDKKQNDYGSGNIGYLQEHGVFERLVDKVIRLKRYMDGVEMQNESVEDTWLDIIGYGLIGLVCHRGQWPETDLSDLLKPIDTR